MADEQGVAQTQPQPEGTETQQQPDAAAAHQPSPSRKSPSPRAQRSQSPRARRSPSPHAQPPQTDAQSSSQESKRSRSRSRERDGASEKKSDTTTIAIPKIAQDVTEADLRQQFASCGDIEDVMVYREQDITRCYGFVKFTTAEAFKRALDMKTVTLQGKSYEVQSTDRKTKVFVGSLPRDANGTALEKLVAERAGAKFRFVDMRNGYAFVVYQDSYEAARSIGLLKDAQLSGQTINVQFARDPVGMEAAQDSAKKTVYVSSIPASVTEDQLREHFGPFGTVVKVFVIKDRKTGKSREFGFVEYASEAEALEAIRRGDGSTMDGVRIKCERSRPLKSYASRDRDRRPPAYGGYPQYDDRGYYDRYRRERSPPRSRGSYRDYDRYDDYYRRSESSRGGYYDDYYGGGDYGHYDMYDQRGYYDDRRGSMGGYDDRYMMAAPRGGYSSSSYGRAPAGHDDRRHDSYDRQSSRYRPY